MAGSRTLKLSILADVDDLKRKLGDADKDVEGFGSKVSNFGKKAGLAFAAAGAAAAAYAGKLLVDGVKAAIEDEKAQTALATSLKNVAGANDTVIAGVEKYITKTALAVGVTDDKLRPSFDRLVRSTKDVEEAQKLQTLALDIAAGSGKSLEAVSQALGKAYEGNTSSLGRLGVGISATQLKTMSFNEVTKTLAATFGGQATQQADTFAGKMARLNIAFDEGKETVGSFVLDAITPLINQFVEKGIPAIQSFAEEIGPKLEPIIEGVSKFVQEILLPAVRDFYEFLYLKLIPFLVDTFKPVFEGLKNALKTIKNSIDDNREGFEKLQPVIKVVAEFIRDKVAPILSGAFKIALEVIGKIVGGLIDGFGSLAGFIGDAYNALVQFINLIRNNPFIKGISGLIDKAFGGFKATGGAVNSSQSYIVGERGPELFVPNTAGRIVPNNAMGGQSIVINVNAPSVIDEEGFTRSIINALNQTQARTGAGAGKLVFS